MRSELKRGRHDERVLWCDLMCYAMINDFWSKATNERKTVV